MRMTLRKSALGVVAAVTALASACQTYDFEPVEPLGIAQRTEKTVVVSRKLKPNIMLVVDKSGSMLFTVEGGSTTRLDEMKSAMGDFLTQSGDLGRFGLAVFPNAADSATQCREGYVVQEISSSNDVATELQAAAAQINDTVQQIDEQGGLPAQGGTPTAATLRALASNEGLQHPDRVDIVVLLTDGLPNCNAQHPTPCVCTNGGSSCSASNCLDDAASVAAINDLRAQGISTIVVGFGADTGADLGRNTLNAMALAGGYARSCETNADCGADTCDTATKTCSQKFYQAANAAELTAVLQQISLIVGTGNPCEYRFENTQATEPEFVIVYIDDERISSGPDTWTYSEASGTSTITFTGDLCNRLLNASPQSPVDLEIRILEAL